MTSRHTISRPATISGIGLHTGLESSATFLPGVPGSGVVFERGDVPGRPRIPATLEYVQEVERRTELAADGSRVSTVEHVLAAVRGLDIDDLTVKLSGAEPPILDGSALPFVELLIGAGIADAGDKARVYEPASRIVVREGESEYEVTPGVGYTVTAEVHWPHPAIGTQRYSHEVTQGAFRKEVAGARTFGFAHEADALRGRGLALGASEDNVIVLGSSAVLNGPLRWPDEFVRHKVLDLIGDLALLGGKLRGHVVARRPGHRGNIGLARAIKQHCSTGE